MEAHDYPVDHFERMRVLAEALKRLPAQLLEHHYHYQSFGSWYFLVRCKGVVAQVAFEGRDAHLGLRLALQPKPPYTYGAERPIGEGASFGKLDAAAVEKICNALVS